MNNYLPMIADKVINRPLMVMPEKLALITQVLEGRIGIEAVKAEGGLVVGGQLEPDASRFIGTFEPVDSEDPKGPKKPYRSTREGVAIISIIGSLVSRGSWLDAFSGITSYERLKRDIAMAAADEDISSIILDIDSPGGEAVGAFEAADVVRAAAALKPIIAVANGLCCSAAYAIASAATKIIASPSSLVGSIGVVMLHVDHSHRLHEAGVVPTLIHAGARKVDGNPYSKLTDDVRENLAAEVNKFMDLFVAGVAAGRIGLTEDAIRATEARVFLGADAVAAGLADEVGAFEGAIANLSTRGVSRSFNANSKGNRMAKENEPATGFTQEQMNAAVSAARTEAHAEGVKIGTTAERDRFQAIASSEKAKGKEKQALALAFTGASLEQADAMLAVAAPDAGAAAEAPKAGLEQRMQGQDSAVPPEAQKDAQVTSLADRMRARHGVK